MIAPTSQVDESLFGAPHRDVQRQQMRDDRSHSADCKLDIVKQADERTERRKNSSKKETVQIVTKDLVRQLM